MPEDVHLKMNMLFRKYSNLKGITYCTLKLCKLAVDFQ